jgi:hypothetical protein
LKRVEIEAGISKLRKRSHIRKKRPTKESRKLTESINKNQLGDRINK